MEINYNNYSSLKEQKLKRAEIAQIFGIPDWKLKKIIAANGWGVSRPKVENISAFEEETEEAYYWAGFIAADGCIGDDNDLGLCLHHDDLVQVENFKKYLKAGHKIYTNTDKYNRAALNLRISQRTADILKTKFNIIPRKSLVYKLPNISSELLFWSFIRGYFDGDGCICESFSNINSITATLYTTITGSKDFIKELESIFISKYNITGSIQILDSCAVLKFNTNSSLLLLKYMYSDAQVYLPRKYKLFEKIVINNTRMIR